MKDRMKESEVVWGTTAIAIVDAFSVDWKYVFVSLISLCADVAVTTDS